jgi:hypothetical protein
VPSLNSTELRRALTGKLSAIEEEKRKDRKYTIFTDDGAFLASTSMSHSWQKNVAIGESMVATIARQLGLRSSELIDLVACTISRAEYVALIQEGSGS